MSARPGIVANAYVDADGGESPNQFKPYVSAEIRCHWPPLATDEQIRQAIDDAMHDVIEQIAGKRSRANIRGHIDTLIQESGRKL